MEHELLNLSLSELFRRYPYIRDFFTACSLPAPKPGDSCLREWIAELEYFTLDEVGLDREELPGLFLRFMDMMQQRRGEDLDRVETVSVLGGHDKDGNSERCELHLRRGEVVSLVGATGSGKSRLLADIEWLAQGDTPSGRTVLVNGALPRPEWRFAPNKKLVAQLSQNMNFVMDINVERFLQIHCETRGLPFDERQCSLILETANSIAGEAILPDMPVTALSGGQSRALMIADTSVISRAPIILIDEIENAGINRQRAIDVLLQAEKIVCIATHDPILALRADRRVVIRNGAISRILETSPGERDYLKRLEAISGEILRCRERLRCGETLG